MSTSTSSAEIYNALRAFVAPSTRQALLAVGLDVALYGSLVGLAIMADPLWLRCLAAIGAGGVISGLFVLGHDAAHNSLTRYRGLNRGLGRLLLFPALHNYTLWRVQHNRLHHRHPNVQHLNSWSPLSPHEFQALPAWRRFLERFYRSGLGFWAYYLVHRWWRDKLFPSNAFLQAAAHTKRNAWLDFTFLVVGSGLFLTAILLLAQIRHHSSPLNTVVFGWLLPYLVWNHMMGQTVYFQHTHPKVPWFRTTEAMERLGGQERVSVYLRQPIWWDHASHYIANHAAHHVNPLIPHNRLRAAQMKLTELAGSAAVAEPWSLRLAFDVLRRCKLYDYEQHCWTDFAGRPTTEPLGVPRIARRG